MVRYEIPSPYHDLISPVEFEALADECKDDEMILDLLTAWVDPIRRAEMQEWAISFIESQAEFQIKDENVLRVAIYGPPGKGKSEIAASIAFLITEIYQEHGVDIIAWPLISRSPSDANDVLAKHTSRGDTICLVLDEKERQSGLASTTDLNALVQNIDTGRVLLNSLIMIAITKSELGKLISRCQIVFRAIFKDKVNRINWCIMYINDVESETQIPMAIVDIPLHKHEWFRKWYKEDKMTQQVDLTVGGGRSKVDPKNVIDITKQVMTYLKRHKILKPRAGQIREILLTEIPNTLIGEEKDAVVNRTLRLLEKDKKKPKPWQRPVDDEILWVGDEFDWKIRISNLLKESAVFPEKYWNVWYATEVEGLSINKDQKKIKEIVGLSYYQMSETKKRMKKDESFQGWVNHTRGEMFEDFLRKKFEGLGYDVKKKPKVLINDKEYEEDMLIHRDGQKLFINAKCGTGYTHYVADTYKTTHLIKTVLNEAAWIVYYDYGAGIYSVHDPAAARLNVGSTDTSSIKPFVSSKFAKLIGLKPPISLKKLKSHKLSDAERMHSRPLLFSAVLNRVLLSPWAVPDVAGAT